MHLQSLDDVIGFPLNYIEYMYIRIWELFLIFIMNS